MTKTIEGVIKGLRQNMLDVDNPDVSVAGLESYVLEHNRIQQDAITLLKSMQWVPIENELQQVPIEWFDSRYLWAWDSDTKELKMDYSISEDGLLLDDFADIVEIDDTSITHLTLPFCPPTPKGGE